jgi:hypothetical protein
VALAAGAWLVGSGWAVDGLETGLALGLLAAGCAAWLRGGPGWASGILLGLASLARLELALVPVLLAALVARTDRRGAASTLVPTVMTLAGWFSFNALRFDTVLPISGVVKSRFPFFWPNPSFYPTGSHFSWMVGAAVVVASGFVVARRSAPSPFRTLVLGLALFGAADLAWMVGFEKFGVNRWQFTYYAIALAALASTSRPASVVAVAAFAWAAIVGHVEPLQNRPHLYEAALWARTHLPRSERIAVTDAGAFAYFRGGNVVALDGLVEDRAFQTELVDRGLARWLATDDIACLAALQAPAFTGSYQWRFDTRSMLFDRPVGGVLVSDADEIWTGVTDAGDVRLALWRRPPGGWLAAPTPRIERRHGPRDAATPPGQHPREDAPF